MNIGIIPARLNSSRFPKKILTPIFGKPMIAHVAERASKAKKLDKVILAVDSNETKMALSDFNFEIMMTKKDHLSGTDRITEVARNFKQAKVIINIQGDEPLIDPENIDSLVDVFKNDEVLMATIITKKLSSKDLIDSNVVKVLVDENQNAINFKREVFDMEIGGLYRHIGIYGFRKKTLFHFSSLSPSELELRYNLEQLRALENGIMIKTILTEKSYQSVDTKEDLKKILSSFKQEDFTEFYG